MRNPQFNALSSVRNPYVFFANRGSGLRHAFLVSVYLRVTGVGLDPLITNALKLLLLSLSSSSTVALKGGGDGVDDCFGVIGRKDVGSVWRIYFLGE